MAFWILNDNPGVEALMNGMANMTCKRNMLATYHPEPVPCIEMDPINTPEDLDFIRQAGRALRLQFPKAALLQFVEKH